MLGLLSFEVERDVKHIRMRAADLVGNPDPTTTMQKDAISR